MVAVVAKCEHPPGTRQVIMLDFQLLKKFELLTRTFLMVGVTGLEPATSRPPAVRATSCATPRRLRVMVR